MIPKETWLYIYKNSLFYRTVFLVRFFELIIGTSTILLLLLWSYSRYTSYFFILKWQKEKEREEEEEREMMTGVLVAAAVFAVASFSRLYLCWLEYLWFFLRIPEWRELKSTVLSWCFSLGIMLAQRYGKKRDWTRLRILTFIWQTSPTNFCLSQQLLENIILPVIVARRMAILLKVVSQRMLFIIAFLLPYLPALLQELLWRDPQMNLLLMENIVTVMWTLTLHLNSVVKMMFQSVLLNVHRKEEVGIIIDKFVLWVIILLDSAIEWTKWMVNGNLIFLRKWFRSMVWWFRNWTVTGSGAGCYYANNHDVALYSKSYTSNLAVHLRYYQDSFIAADEFTQGCSYSSPDSTSCFGMSRKEQNITGIVLSVLGGLLIALEIIIIIAMCFCCKESLDSLRKKNKKKEKKIMLVAQTAQAVPIAQPVYPPQQPSYDPQQPSYAPQQPSYDPQQPSYAPQQPGYIPQQPSYAPQQPSYAPQQTGYIPQYGYPQ